MDIEQTGTVDITSTPGEGPAAPAPDGGPADTPPGAPGSAAGAPGDAGASYTSPAPDWLTREEAAAALGKTVRTVDRMRGGGILVDVPGPGPVRVTVASVEAFLQHKVTPRPAVEMMQISHSMYQGLNLQLQHKARLIDELSQRLLTWEGAEAAHAAEVQRLEEERVAAERALEVEREEAAAKLEAERARAAETLAAAKAAAEQRLEKHLEEQRTQFTAEALAAIAEERAKAQAAEAELEAERARGFWSRLFGR